MPKLRFGSQGQVSFRDLNEFYFALGFLSNSKNAEIRWENNEEQGAWGSEGRIHCLVPESQFPQFFRFTAGRGSVYARINCNDYVGCLVQEHNFSYNSRRQNVSKIMETVPEKYRETFKAGYGGNLDINPVFRQPINTEPKTKPQNSQQQVVRIEINTPKTIAPKPIKVDVGDTITHKAFGRGTVYEIDGQYLRIHFEKDGDKSFLNPDAFEKGFLSKT